MLRTQAQFRIDTGLIKESRKGNKIAFVDAALGDYDSVRLSTDNDARLAALRLIAKAAAWWLYNKEKKEKTQTVHRKKIIGDVLDEAIAEIGSISEPEALYARQKCRAIRNNWVHPILKTKMLSKRVKGASFTAADSPYITHAKGGYAHERKDYLKKGKQSNPISGTKMHGAFKGSDADWNKISYGDFEKLAKVYKANASKNGLQSNTLVEFYKREDRLEWILSCDDGIYSYLSGRSLVEEQKFLKNNGLYRYPMMYAMDRYGNIYAREPVRARKEASTRQFNHTSFCAGNEVVCAGSILFTDKGQLVYISNASGHYQPDEQALIRALNRIAMDKTDLSKVRAGVSTKDGYKFYNAQDLRKGTKTPWDRSLDKDLQMADDFAE